MESSVPSIPEFYRGKGIFITGATGFMGKVLVEKILRSCPEVKTLYLLVRPKKGKEPVQRIEEIVSSKLFNTLREDYPEFHKKLIPVCGDILHDNLGVCQTDEQKMIDNVQIVFHSAATVRFDEEMKLSVEMNVHGTNRVLQFCKKLVHIESFLHVSTAYANCNVKKIEEKVYEPPLHPSKILDATGWMGTEILNMLTPKMIKDRPNTYTYTKSIAEYLVHEARRELPVAIFRPSIVGASWEEPVPGWVDNFNGPTGLLAAIGNGLLRNMIGDSSKTADIIPVDTASNMMIASAWNTAVNRSSVGNVYHCTTGQLNKLTWGMVERDSYKYFMKNPVNTVTRIPNPRFTKNLIYHEILMLFDHMIPAYIMDFFLWIQGKRTIFVKIQDRLRRSVGSLDFFTSNEWEFANGNLYMLLNKMTTEDQKTFNFDPKLIDWSKYMERYCLGTKQFVLKEELSELPRARKTLQRLQRINLCINVFGIIILWRLLMNRFTIAKSLWNFLMGWALKIFKSLPTLMKAT